MDVPERAQRDVLALPLRAELFEALSALCRPATTQELAERIGRHHNTVRIQLQRLAASGLVERRVLPQARGRPRDVWAVAADAAPGGRPPEAHGQLSRWLARAIAGPGDLASIEATGREIGRELIDGGDERKLGERMRDALAAMGFVPRMDPPHGGTLRFVLRNCPYREAVLQNQPAICGLHRGITAGLLDRLEPRADLIGFEPKDPLLAGCVVDIRA